MTDALGYQPHIVTGYTSGTIFRLSVSRTGRSTGEVNYGEGFGTFIPMVTLSCITDTEREKSFRAIEDVVVTNLVMWCSGSMYCCLQMIHNNFDLSQPNALATLKIQESTLS